MNTKDKIIFFISFVVFYAILLIIGVLVFGSLLTSLEENIIHLILGNYVNYQAFEFVVYCSGIVSVATYLGVVFGLLVIKIKPKLKIVLIGIILLLLINILRIIAVMLSETLGIEQLVHVFSWFLMGIIIIWLIKESYK